MEPRRPKQTPRTGENKPANPEVQQKMIILSNNSRLTQDTARMLTNKLTRDELNELSTWLRHATREQANKLANGRRF